MESEAKNRKSFIRKYSPVALLTIPKILLRQLASSSAPLCSFFSLFLELQLQILGLRITYRTLPLANPLALMLPLCNTLHLYLHFHSW